MNPKSKESKFEIQQTTSLPTVASQGPLTPFTPERAKNQDERWIQDEWRKRMAIMQAITIEVQYAQDANAYLTLKNVSIADQTSRYIYDIRSAEREEALQPFMDKFCQRALEDFATRQFGIYDVAVANIAFTIHRDHYPPEQEPENKGFWSRLFGS